MCCIECQSVSFHLRYFIALFLIVFFYTLNFYRLVTDNVDLAVQARHQSKSHQNKSLHWIHSFAVKNRVIPSSNLDDFKPQKQVKDLEMVDILPSQDEQAYIKSNMIILVFRVICQYLTAYKEFTSAVIHHIPHEFSSQMKQKSEQVKI